MVYHLVYQVQIHTYAFESHSYTLKLKDFREHKCVQVYCIQFYMESVRKGSGKHE